MRVVFVQYGTDISYARMMVESCKRQGYVVWQLSDDVAPMVEGVDNFTRFPKDCGGMLYRARRLAELEGEYVLMDTDMIVAQDISGGLEGDHDVALTWRERHVIATKHGVEPMPYNGGLVFVRNNDFMRDVAAEMETMDEYFQDWFGDQIAIRNVVADGKYKVLELRDKRWNSVPDKLDDLGHEARIFHFKGKRKSMMRHFWENS